MHRIECPSCRTTTYPDIQPPADYEALSNPKSRVECPNCARKLGTVSWELL